VAALVFKFACCQIEVDLDSGKLRRSLVVTLKSAESNSVSSPGSRFESAASTFRTQDLDILTGVQVDVNT
jgi:hypothetical protein